MSLPLPSDENSFRVYVETEWSYILKSWKGGWAADSCFHELESQIEFERIKIFEKKDVSNDCDWELDWIHADHIH